MPWVGVPTGFATASVNLWIVTKLAFTLCVVVIETVQGPVPVQAPAHPAKADPAAGCGTRLTLVPLGKKATQEALEHSTPIGSLVTRPLPATRVVSGNGDPGESCRTKT